MVKTNRVLNIGIKSMKWKVNNRTKVKMMTVLALVISILMFSNPIKAQERLHTIQSLSPTEKSIIKIAALTARGDLGNLKRSLIEGLESGLTVNEIKETLVHIYAYCGFPRSIQGLQTFIAVLEERKTAGIKDQWGKEASVITDSRDKYIRGKEILDELVQRKQEGPKPSYAQFSPEIEIFLKEHLFADLFERDVLTYAQRELVTISALSSLGSVEPMLRGHLNISLNLGWTPEKLNEFITIIKTTLGRKEAKTTQKVLDEVLKKK